jgi:hypothetical protein
MVTLASDKDSGGIVIHHRPGYPGSNRPGCLKLAGALLTAITLAACGSGSPSASPSSLATNAAVIRAEHVWKPTVDTCAQNRHWVVHFVRSGKATITCVVAKVPPGRRHKVKMCATKAVARIPGAGYLAAVKAGLFSCLQGLKPTP